MLKNIHLQHVAELRALGVLIQCPKPLRKERFSADRTTWLVSQAPAPQDEGFLSYRAFGSATRCKALKEAWRGQKDRGSHEMRVVEDIIWSDMKVNVDLRTAKRLIGSLT